MVKNKEEQKREKTNDWKGTGLGHGLKPKPKTGDKFRNASLSNKAKSNNALSSILPTKVKTANMKRKETTKRKNKIIQAKKKRIFDA
jgi:hypothetical protein